MTIDKVALREWAYENTKGVEQHVSLALIEFVNPDSGYAWPSIGTVADRTGLGRSTVKRALASLTKSGAWSVQPTGRTSRYTPNPHYRRPEPTEKRVQIEPSEGSERAIRRFGAGHQKVHSPHTEKEVNKELNKEENNAPATQGNLLADDDPFAPYDPKPVAAKAVEQSDDERWAYAVAAKAVTAGKGAVKKYAAKEAVLTAVRDGGEDRDKVEAAAIAIASQRKSFGVAFLYDVLAGRRSPDGSFINAPRAGQRPAMPLDADKPLSQRSERSGLGYGSPASGSARSDAAGAFVTVSQAKHRILRCQRDHDHADECYIEQRVYEERLR